MIFSLWLLKQPGNNIGDMVVQVLAELQKLVHLKEAQRLTC